MQILFWRVSPEVTLYNLYNIITLLQWLVGFELVIFYTAAPLKKRTSWVTKCSFSVSVLNIFVNWMNWFWFSVLFLNIERSTWKFTEKFSSISGNRGEIFVKKHKTQDDLKCSQYRIN